MVQRLSTHPCSPAVAAGGSVHLAAGTVALLVSSMSERSMLWLAVTGFGEVVVITFASLHHKLALAATALRETAK